MVFSLVCVCLCSILLHTGPDFFKHLALDIIATCRILLFPTYVSTRHLRISSTGIKLKTSVIKMTWVKKPQDIYVEGAWTSITWVQCVWQSGDSIPVLQMTFRYLDPID